MSEPQFFIDGKPYKLENNPEKVSQLLLLAGTSFDDSILISENGVEFSNPDELIYIKLGEHFKTRKRNSSQKPVEKPIHYSVNGEENITLVNPLSLSDILENAGAGAAIDVNDLGNYYLENTEDGSKYENLNDLVTIMDGDKFLAIHVGSTPVA